MESIFGKASGIVGKSSGRVGKARRKKKQGGVGGGWPERKREGWVGNDVIKKIKNKKIKNKKIKK